MKRWFALAALVAAAPLVLATAHPATAQTAEQLEQQYGREAMAQALDVKRRYDLYGIHFETGKTAIQQDSHSLLDDIAAVMQQFPDWRLEIVGHTDAAGDPAQNEALSRTRADAVKAALVQRGIEAGRLEPEGMGEGQPVASNDTTEGRALNRRVELVRQDQKPNILFIMGDDIGWMQPSIYHQGLMVGETPNIDRIGHEGAKFTDYYAEQSCTAGRTAFFTGMNPLRVGMTLPEIPGSPSYLRTGTPALAKFLLDLGYTTGEFGKNHLGDHTESLPTAHGFQEYWGYLYHLDAMQGVSFPDINKTPTEQTVAPPCKNTPIPGLPEVPGAVDPQTTTCLTPPRPVVWCKSSDGSSANQTCQDQGPLTLERSKTVDEEISAKVIDFLDRNDPAKTNKPFFVWYNPARMHVTTVLSDKYYNMVGEIGGKDWGVNEAGMKQMDDNIGYVLDKLQAMGQLDNTIVVFTTDNGAETITYPDGGTTPFAGGKLTTWEGGMRAPAVIRWPGHIEPGTVKNDLFSALDWVPTFVNIAGGPKGDGLKKEIEAGKYPGIVKTTLDGFDQIDYLTGKSEKSARDHFFYYSNKTPSAVRYKNWKMYFGMVSQAPAGAFAGVIPYAWTQVVNIKRDPFEASIGEHTKTLFGVGGALGGPLTAYVYDWNMLPIGQVLWLKELRTYIDFPALQNPASYNLDQVIQQIQEMRTAGQSE